jgi:hypothetical protein
LAEQKHKQNGTNKSEDMRLPPVLSKSFWELLANAAGEFGVTRAEFAIRALKHYIKELRIRKSPITEATNEEQAKQYSKIQSKLSRTFWDGIDDEERRKRTAAAREARWPKKKKK